MNHMEECTKTPWPRGLSNKSATEDKVLGFLFYQAHHDKPKQGRLLEACETRISTSNFDAKDRATLLRISLMDTTALVENCDRYQLLGNYQLNQYLCAFLEILNKNRYILECNLYGYD